MKYLLHAHVSRWYCLFRFFCDAALIYPVYLIMFRAHGLAFDEIATLLALWAGAMLVGEVPSGILADRWSRSGTMLLGMLAKAAGFAVWLLFPCWAGFLAGFVLWGIQEAMISGTAEAFLFAALSRTGRADDFERVNGRGQFSSRAAHVIALLAGGWLYDSSPDLVLILSSAAMLAAALCLLPLVRFDKTKGKRSTVPSPSSTELIALVRLAVRQRGMLPLLAFGCLTGAAYGVIDEYDTLFGTTRGVPVALIGIWAAARVAVEGLGCLAVPFLTGRAGLRRPTRLALWTVIAALCLAAGMAGPDVLLAGYFLFFMMIAPVEVIWQGKLQRRIDETGRATFTSLASLLLAGAGIVIGLVYGLIAELLGLPALFVTGAVIIAGVAVFWGHASRHDREHAV